MIRSLLIGFWIVLAVGGAITASTSPGHGKGNKEAIEFRVRRTIHAIVPDPHQQSSTPTRHDLVMASNRTPDAAAGRSGVFASRDGGSSWQAIDGGLSVDDFHGLGLTSHPTDHNRLYLVQGPVAGARDRHEAGGWHTTDGGVWWNNGESNGMVAPTNQPTPSANSMPTPPARPSAPVSAMFFSTYDAPTIDGQPDSLWAQARAHSVGKTVLGSPPAETNLSAYFRALYDTRALYLFVDITDDRLVQDSSEEWWEDDAIELYLDGNASLLQEYDDIDDYQVVLRWDDDAVYIGGDSVQAPADLNWAHRQTGKGWAAEIAFPWSALGITAQPGVRFGIDLHVSDDDDDGAREHKLAWHADRDDAWHTPSLFGLVGLGENEFIVNLPLALSQPAPAATPSATPAASPTPTIHPPAGDPPANPNASPETRQLLAYLQIQSDTCAVLSGQNIGSGGFLYDHYGQLIDGLQRATGRWPALVGLDYYDYDDDHTDYAESHPPLIEHWNAGGLVTLSWSSLNPWTGGDAWDTRSADLTELLDPSTAAHQTWMAQLDDIAEALADLRDAGVVVLWRPLHEMSGDWFWWGTRAHPGNPAPYQALWRQMFDYFTDIRKLDNLLWVYSAAASDSSLPSPDLYYPGDAYVDIVAQSVYDGVLETYGYETLLALGKPVALGEFGPGQTWIEPQDGDYDYRQLLTLLRSRYPRTLFWLSWHDWVENGQPVHMAIVTNQNASALMNDACVTSRDEVDWRAQSASTAMPTPEAP